MDIAVHYPYLRSYTVNQPPYLPCVEGIDLFGEVVGVVSILFGQIYHIVLPLINFGLDLFAKYLSTAIKYDHFVAEHLLQHAQHTCLIHLVYGLYVVSVDQL